jgi:hypothetical protein
MEEVFKQKEAKFIEDAISSQMHISNLNKKIEELESRLKSERYARLILLTFL